MNSNKRIIVIGSVLIGLIMLFTAVFLYFGSKDVADLKKQLSDLDKEQRQLLTETTKYDKSIQTEDFVGNIKGITDKGNRIAELETQIMKFAFENVNPIDAYTDGIKIDPKIYKELSGYFPEESDYRNSTPWLTGENFICKFEPVFQYKTSGIIGTWSISVNDRMVGFATAEYDPDKKAFFKLKIYETIYGGTMQEEAYTKMVNRANGITEEEPIDPDDPNYNPEQVTPEEAEADPFLDPDGDGFIGEDDPFLSDEDAAKAGE